MHEPQLSPWEDEDFAMQLAAATSSKVS